MFEALGSSLFETWDFFWNVVIEYFIFLEKESHRRMFSLSFGLGRLGDYEEDEKEECKRFPLRMNLILNDLQQKYLFSMSAETWEKLLSRSALHTFFWHSFCYIVIFTTATKTIPISVTISIFKFMRPKELNEY